MKLVDTRRVKITYLLESTDLWGGVKVVFEQAEALSESGYDVTILSKDSNPAWYPLKIPIVKVREFNNNTIPESDLIIGTYWTTLRDACTIKKGILVHLCQGYEAGNKELKHLKEQIDNVYKLKIPKLTISPHLNQFLEKNFNSETYYIGQMINREIFYPDITKDDKNNKNFKILVIGPFEADVKNIATSIKGILIAKKEFNLPIILVRVSQFKLTEEEKSILEPDYYYFHIPYTSMGEIYRNSDLLISMSKEAEGFGLPPVEAMACGIPTILSIVPAHLSYDNEHNYALFTESTPESVAEAILKIYRDSNLRNKIKENALVLIKNFSKESFVSRLIDSFEKILNKYK